jgi:ribosomal-protein-alanine N-acetyltransferase
MTVSLREIHAQDLPVIAQFDFTVSIVNSLPDITDLERALAETGFWSEQAGARAIVVDGAMVGTCQFYRSAPCVHGYELGYIIHDPANRGKGYATAALSQLSEMLFREQPGCFRLQLMIEVWNTASWKVAERCGYIREGLLRSSGFGSGDPSDCFIYARTRKDWHEQRTANPSMGGAVSGNPF